MLLCFTAACVSIPDASDASNRPATGGEPVLAASGILVAGLPPAPGQGTEISFGRTEASTLRAVTALLGNAPTDVADMPQCDTDGLRFATWPRDGLFLLFQNGNFRGWSVTDSKFNTTGGLRIGQTAADSQAKNATTHATRYGPEVRLNGVTGSIDVKGKVSSLSAGVTCFL